jgi:hypothetical protein
MFILHLSAVVASVPNGEIYALNALYNSTNGDEWLWRSESLRGPKWNFTTSDANPCNTNGEVWQGIECSLDVSLCGDVQACHITSITMGRYNMQGTLPEALELLSSLVTFDIHANFIYGTIPKIFAYFINLEKINLSKNKMTGTIPPELGNIASLQRLSLHSNALNGTIPPELGNIASLQRLSLHSNALTGTIPPELGNIV